VDPVEQLKSLGFGEPEVRTALEMANTAANLAAHFLFDAAAAAAAGADAANDAGDAGDASGSDD
jgi:hypothetical protein